MAKNQHRSADASVPEYSDSNKTPVMDREEMTDAIISMIRGSGLSREESLHAVSDVLVLIHFSGQEEDDEDIDEDLDDLFDEVQDSYEYWSEFAEFDRAISGIDDDIDDNIGDDPVDGDFDEDYEDLEEDIEDEDLDDDDPCFDDDTDGIDPDDGYPEDGPCCDHCCEDCRKGHTEQRFVSVRIRGKPYMMVVRREH